MKRLVDYLVLTVGSVIVAAGLELILAPNELVDGGITAIAIMVNHIGDIPIWLTFIMLNIPTLIVAARYMGQRFVYRTLYANLITGIGLYWMAPLPAITSSEVLIVLYGGLLLGVGIGLVVKAGGAIDGTEMIAIWLNKRYHIPISTFLLGINAIILSAAAFVFTIEKAMFSIAVFYIVSKMIDFVLDGLNQGKSVMIISEKPDEVAQAIMDEFEIGVTYLYGEGGYTGDQRKIVYCITNRFLYPKLKELVLAIDASAVIEASYVAETTGVKQPVPFSFDRWNREDTK
ncbi:uncharacterized membrane-anchored protein YitT (DUF2179 family) [Caldalkalibacillus uzonensis]|uniref:Uncharacterized membrane-anchored protein YitT (DUF2179 family) n=1 Tax=Caldalkalibacillus uzonensis TaxID=353224 RepID=A0ABU0CV91_9BACI|nr:YitT family protein [Caldalkalibacillus uzonensis]MDQ0340345.1 uncharacterized membrane-anchored protein YitT (DUF2179 family) [Caldalkalibacillus uzonensis]